MAVFAFEAGKTNGPYIRFSLKLPFGALSPWFKALEDVRRKASREGWCYQHVQAIIVAIDQYAEAATGNREYFLNKPVSMARESSRL